MENKGRSQVSKSASVSQHTDATALSQSSVDFCPSQDEVARRAYSSYENEGSLPGRDVQQWLAAEAQLFAEHNGTRVHGFHNQT
jgi:hypothetical protein